MTALEEILRAQRGRYLWGVRIGEGSLLSWQVGEPHLHVEMGRTPAGFDRRHADVRGRWQVEIVDGEVGLTSPLGSRRLTPDEALGDDEEALLDHLEGQALVSVTMGEGLVLRFDLEAEVTVGGPRALVRVSGPEGEAEWAP